MIVTKNAHYLHIPKTGGTWIRKALEPIIVSTVEHGIPKDKVSPAFVFVRNPWDWYASFYKFHTTGSTTYTVEHLEPFSSFISRHSFNEFVALCSNPTLEFKKEFLALAYADLAKDKEFKDRSRAQPFMNWLNTDCSFYDIVTKSYCDKATRIGQYENLKEELLDMVRQAGDLTDEVHHNIVSLPNINVTTQGQYQSFYDTLTADLVNSTTHKYFNYSL